MKQINTSITPLKRFLLKNKGKVLLLAGILFFSSCQKFRDGFPTGKEPGKPGSADDATIATDWYKLQLRMVLQSSPAKSNIAVNHLFAYSGISLYEASRFENHELISLQGQLDQMPAMPLPENGRKYSWKIAANAAMAFITRSLFPGITAGNTVSIDSLESLYNARVTATDGSEIVARSQAFGDSIASAIFAWSKTDLFNHVSDPYTPPVFPGAWVPTPPAFAAAAAPHTGNCRTFLHIFAEGTVPPPPFPYSEDPNSDFYKMVNNDYQISKTLTTDQKNIALFWDDVGAGIGYTPMGHSISILTQVLDNSNASLATADEAYAKAGIAIWDATIVCWRSKFEYNQIRPVSYIQQHIDITWLPFIVTPAHPEYPAAHAFITSAIMEVISSVFGKNYSFTDHTYDFLSYPARSYSSFEDAALECGESRVYGGIHYQPSVDVGHKFGSLVGLAVAAIEVKK
jgi:hypothetical protein